MIAFVLGWVKLIPLRDWLGAAALAALFVAVLFWNHHERAIGRADDLAKVTAAQNETAGVRAQLGQVQQANQACAGAIKSLQLANAQCETGRLADIGAQAKALSDRDAFATKLKSDAAAARAKLQASLTGVCKSWADQPACGVTP